MNAVLFGGSGDTKEYNEGLRERYALGQWDSRQFYEQVKKALGLDMTYGQFADAWCEMFEPHREIASFVQCVRNAGVPQCVLSSTDPLHMEKMASVGGLRESIGHERFVTTYDVGVKKPHRRLLERVEEVLHLPREKLVIVEDIPKYIEAFRQYGVGGGVHVKVGQPDFQSQCISDVCSTLGLDAGVIHPSFIYRRNMSL